VSARETPVEFSRNPRILFTHPVSKSMMRTGMGNTSGTDLRSSPSFERGGFVDLDGEAVDDLVYGIRTIIGVARSWWWIIGRE